MRLEKILSDKFDERDTALPAWLNRHFWLRKVGWAAVKLLYLAESHGPRTIEGPSLVIFDIHTLSLDNLMPAVFYNYMTMVAKKGGAKEVLSNVAKYEGSPIINRGREGMLNFKDQFAYLLSRDNVVGVFPFSDLNDHVLRTGVVKQAIRFEEAGFVKPVKYVAGAIRYHDRLRTEPLRVWHNWPAPWLTKAEIFVSDRPILLADLPPEKRNAKGVMDAVLDGSASLQEKYQK